jgi:chromosome segregation ATPase
MRQETITYDVFYQAIQKMQAENEKISVRTVLSHIGGSFPKVAGFLKRWRQEQAHAQAAINHELSPNVRQVIIAEIGKAVAETKAFFEKQLAEASEQIDETNEALSKQERRIEDYEQEIYQLNQQLATANELPAKQLEKITSLEKKLEQTIEAQHRADKQAAIAETRCNELEKQLARQEGGKPNKQAGKKLK